MEEDFLPAWRPEPEEPTPQNAVEKLMRRASHDPGVHGELMRQLWKSELTAVMPYHPEMLGTHELHAGQSFSFQMYTDQRGEFIPAFTSEAVADYCLQKLAPEGTHAVGVVTLPGEVFFSMLRGKNLRVVINGGMSDVLDMGPTAVESLVNGEFRHKQPATGVAQRVKLATVPLSTVPESFLDGVRHFCDKRRSAIGVYLFYAFEPGQESPSLNDWRLILWLRHPDTDFYNDLSLVLGKLCPENVEVSLALITPENEDAMNFLQRCQPLWPMLETSL
jgi:hypothetical protein